MKTLQVTTKDRLIELRDRLMKQRSKERKETDLSYMEGCLDFYNETLKIIDNGD